MIPALRAEAADDSLFARVLLKAGRTGRAKPAAFPLHHKHGILVAVFASKRADRVYRVASRAADLLAHVGPGQGARPKLEELAEADDRGKDQQRVNDAHRIAGWRIAGHAAAVRIIPWRQQDPMPRSRLIPVESMALMGFAAAERAGASRFI